MWQTNLIKLYCAVSEHDNTMEAMTQRQSNNFRPEFSDEECITVYLRGICQRRFEQRTINDYTKNHLLDWFPKLPSYAAFSRRLSFLVPAFQALAEEWLTVILEKSAKEKSIGNLKKLKKDEGAKRVQQKDRRRNAGLGRNYRRTQMCSFGTGPEGPSSLARYSFTLP